jgi:hypothetical protein
LYGDIGNGLVGSRKDWLEKKYGEKGNFTFLNCWPQVDNRLLIRFHRILSYFHLLITSIEVFHVRLWWPIAIRSVDNRLSMCRRICQLFCTTWLLFLICYFCFTPLDTKLVYCRWLNAKTDRKRLDIREVMTVVVEQGRGCDSFYHFHWSMGISWSQNTKQPIIYCLLSIYTLACKVWWRDMKR